MKKNGFTLVELLAVIAIVAIVSVISVFMYEKSNEKVKEDELTNIYLDIQRSAVIYMDLNESSLESLREEGYNYVSLDTLKKNNYISKNLKNPVTNELIESNYLIKVYIANKNEIRYLDTCIIKDLNTATCIANSEGEASNCCDF